MKNLTMSYYEELKRYIPNVTADSQTGFTSGISTPSKIVNWVASDTVTKYKGVQNDQLLIAIWVHEVGNALAIARYKYSAGTKSPDYGKEIKAIQGWDNKGLNDKDAGAALENCVYGGIVNLSSGLVGTRR